jgi:hypothetical protein
MEKLLLKAKRIPTGKPGLLTFQTTDESLEEQANFLREEHHYEKQRKERQPEYENFYELAIQRWYKRRSLNANNLAWELATRLGQADRVSKDVAYYAVKELVDLPRDEYKGVFVSRPSGQLSTVEFARFIQMLVIECQTHDPAVDIRDIWILFTDWRFGQEKDPLEGTYSGPEDYKEKHPCCEACGHFLRITDNSGVQQHTGQLAHIVSTGAGGPNTDWDWFVLCDKCHIHTQHEHGWEELLKAHEHLREKVRRARERAGKKPLASATGEPSKDQPSKQDMAATAPAVAVGPVTEIVTRVFDGEIVGAPAEAPQEDLEKERMLAKLRGLQKKAGEKQPPQAELFEELKEEEPVSVIASEKELPPQQVSEMWGETPTPAEPPVPSYTEDGKFNVPPDF